MSHGSDSCASLAPKDSDPRVFFPHGNVRSFLEPQAHALHAPLSFYRSRLFPFARLLRAVLRTLFGPWMHVQSYFNLSLVRALEQIEYRVHSLEKKQADLLRMVSALRNTTRSRIGPTSDHARDTVRECLHWRVRLELPTTEQEAVPSQAASDCLTPGDLSKRILEAIFLQTHLPPPSARLLLLGESERHAVELTELGFEVVGADGMFAAESFDAAVAVPLLEDVSANADCQALRPPQSPRAITETFRLLRHGGRFLMSMPLNTHPFAAAGAGWLGDFQILERCYAARVGEKWSWTEEEDVPSTGAVCLLALEKPRGERAAENPHSFSG
jgi:SAM-dependent methyltransferase